MKKLLQINTVVNSGSTGRIAEDIGSMAISNGWSSYIAYGRRPRKSESNLIKIGNKFDQGLHLINTRIMDRHGLGSRTATLIFLKEVDSLKPDIIHLHNIHGYYLNYKELFSDILSINIPVVWTLHDCWAFTGHCSYFSFVNCQKWKTECFNCPNKKTYPKSVLRDRSKQNFADKKNQFTLPANLHLVPVSHWLDKEVRQSFLKCYPSTVIHNGIDLNNFHIIKTNVKRKYCIESKFMILGVANVWDKRKGLDDFMRLSQLLKKDEIIMLVGLSKQQLKGLPSNIIGIQKTENISELAALYSSSDIFLNPTWEDNYPTTNLEAIACGTPVITYRTGGSSESITPETGFVVEQGNLTEVRDIIDIVKKKEKESFSNSCVEYARLHFDKNEKFEQYISLYNTLLGED